MYRRGLKDQVKDKLMRSGADITNLGELIKESIEIDDKHDTIGKHSGANRFILANP